MGKRAPIKQTVKTGQDIIDKQLDDEYAESAVSWWDVADPKAFFGVQGERNATQQANADRFIKEWEEVSDNSRTSRSTLNGLIDGTYDC